MITDLSVTPTARSQAYGWRGAFVLMLALLLSIVVVWSVQFPGQIDAYNHLARHYLELLYFEGAPLPPGIVVHYGILPNLGGDIVIPPLIWLFGPLPALKVFLTLSIILHWIGPAIFILQNGRYSRAAWIASLLFLPLVISGTFLWGFLNYYSSVGLAFLAVVHLRYLDGRAHLSIWQLLVHAALVTLLFFWHLAAIFIYGIFLALVAVRRLIHTWRSGQSFARSCMRAVALCLPTVPAVCLYLVYVGTQEHGAGALSWPPLLRKLLMPLSVLHGFDIKADILVTLLWVAATLLFFGRSLRLGRLDFAAWAAVIFLVLYEIFPDQIGTTSGVDGRLLPALVVCVLAWFGTLPMRGSWIAVALLIAAIGVRDADIYVAWHRSDARLRDEARSFALIEPNSRVLPLILLTEYSKETPEAHFASLAVIERHAYIPALFAVPNQQPLHLTGPTQLVDSAMKSPLAVGHSADQRRTIHAVRPGGRCQVRLPVGL